VRRLNGSGRHVDARDLNLNPAESTNMMNPFDWLRAKTRAAVLDGFCDAVEAIDGGRIERLQERLTLALAAPVESSEGASEPAKGGGKRGAK
jgi:hypothetical protein